MSQEKALSASMQRLIMLARSKAPVVFVETYEEKRALGQITTLLDGGENSVHRYPNMFVFDMATGITLIEGKPEYPGRNAHRSPDKGELPSDPEELFPALGRAEVPFGIWVVLDANEYILEYIYERHVRNAAYAFPDKEPSSNEVSVIHERHGTSPSHMLVLMDTKAKVPDRLTKIVPTIEWDLPSKAEILAMYEGAELTEELSAEEIEGAVRAAQGLTLMEAEGAASLSLGLHDELRADVVVGEKRNLIKASGALEFIDDGIGLDQVGGFDRLKNWLRLRASAFSDKAAAFGIDAPQGVLLTGVPGCGKSLVAKAFGPAWGVPTLRFDLGAVFGKYVGQSESQMREALKLAEATAPCVLWMEELEKALGSSSGDYDGGTSGRVLGQFLAWMQEKRAPVFVVATTNRATALPPELTRAGRFDTMMFVDLPTSTARSEILKIHLKRRNKVVQDADLEVVVAATEGYSGAELEHVVKNSLFECFMDNERDVTADDLLLAAEQVVPLSKSREPEVSALRKWASGRAMWATSQESTVETPSQAASGSGGRLSRRKKTPSGVN